MHLVRSQRVLLPDGGCFKLLRLSKGSLLGNSGPEGYICWRWTFFMCRSPCVRTVYLELQGRESRRRRTTHLRGCSCSRSSIRCRRSNSTGRLGRGPSTGTPRSRSILRSPSRSSTSSKGRQGLRRRCTARTCATRQLRCLTTFLGARMSAPQISLPCSRARRPMVARCALVP